MNCVRVRDFSCRHETGNIQIALFARRRSNADSLIRESNMEGIAIRFRIHGNGLNSQFSARADNSEGYFTPVCYEDFLEQSLFSVRMEFRMGR